LNSQIEMLERGGDVNVDQLVIPQGPIAAQYCFITFQF